MSLAENTMIPHLCECGCGEPTQIRTANNLSKGWVKGEPFRYRRGHSLSHATKPFWSLVDRTGECWIWVGRKTDLGYGLYCSKSRTRRAHRVAWELSFGSIPTGLSVCHSCDNPPCVRPDHILLGTQVENMADAANKSRLPKGRNHWAGRKAHCPQDHLYDLANTGFSRGERWCKTCARERSAQARNLGKHKRRRVCERCGAPFLGKPKQRFCSLDCYHASPISALTREKMSASLRLAYMNGRRSHG